MDLSTFIIICVIVLGTVVSVVSFGNIKKYAKRASPEQQTKMNAVADKVELNRRQLAPYLARYYKR